MSITKVEARTSLGNLQTFELADTSAGYIVEDILGIDPVKATLVSSTFANLDGAKFQKARRETRNIILKIKLNPDYIFKTARELRTQLYSFFNPKTEVSLRFYMADGLVVNISGVVETCEAPLFTQEPRIDVSIICYDPDFVELDAIEVEGFTVATTTEFEIDYPGDVPTGILFTLNLDRDLSEFTIYHRPPDNVLRTFDFAASLLDNDILTISSVVGQKFITLNRSSTITSLLYGKSPQSNWPALQQGVNKLRIYAIGAGIPFTISYTPRYGGL